jgi:hypothetical protein
LDGESGRREARGGLRLLHVATAGRRRVLHIAHEGSTTRSHGPCAQ